MAHDAPASAGGGGGSLRRGMPDTQLPPERSRTPAEQAALDAAADAAAAGRGIADPLGMRPERVGGNGSAAGRGVGAQVPAGVPRTGRGIHTLVTSNGSPYLNFQLRIMCAPDPRTRCTVCAK